MYYEELNQHYGSNIALRIRHELSASEFDMLTIEDLPAYLSMFAELAEKEYQSRIDNPFINEELGAARDTYVEVLHMRWREAEELAFLVLAHDEDSHLKRRAGAE